MLQAMMHNVILRATISAVSRKFIIRKWVQSLPALLGFHKLGTLVSNLVDLANLETPIIALVQLL
jgi:hypothetical protein